MDTIECIKTRRSIRNFKNTPISQDILDDIIDCAQKAPSGHNTQPWSFIIVKDKKKKESLSKVHSWASFIAQAPVCIVVCLTPGENRNPPSNYLSIACAVQNMLLAIHSYGLASCWTYIKDFEDDSVEQNIKNLLNIPEDIEAICMIPIGYPNQKIESRYLKKRDDVLHSEEW